MTEELPLELLLGWEDFSHHAWPGSTARGGLIRSPSSCGCVIWTFADTNGIFLGWSRNGCCFPPVHPIGRWPYASHERAAHAAYRFLICKEPWPINESGDGR